MDRPALRCIAHVSPPLTPMLLRELLRLHQFDGNSRIVRGGTFAVAIHDVKRQQRTAGDLPRAQGLWLL